MVADAGNVFLLDWQGFLSYATITDNSEKNFYHYNSIDQLVADRYYCYSDFLDNKYGIVKGRANQGTGD